MKLKGPIDQSTKFYNFLSVVHEVTHDLNNNNIQRENLVGFLWIVKKVQGLRFKVRYNLLKIHILNFLLNCKKIGQNPTSFLIFSLNFQFTAWFSYLHNWCKMVCQFIGFSFNYNLASIWVIERDILGQSSFWRIKLMVFDYGCLMNKVVKKFKHMWHNFSKGFMEKEDSSKQDKQWKKLWFNESHTLKIWYWIENIFVENDVIILLFLSQAFVHEMAIWLKTPNSKLQNMLHICIIKKSCYWRTHINKL